MVCARRKHGSLLAVKRRRAAEHAVKRSRRPAVAIPGLAGWREGESGQRALPSRRRPSKCLSRDFEQRGEEAMESADFGCSGDRSLASSLRRPPRSNPLSRFLCSFLFLLFASAALQHPFGGRRVFSSCSALHYSCLVGRLHFAIPIFFDPWLDAAVRRYLKAAEEEAAPRKVDVRGDGASFDLVSVRRYLVCYPSLAAERAPLREKALLASEPFNSSLLLRRFLAS